MAVLSTDVARMFAEQQAGFYSSNAYAAQLTQQSPLAGLDYRQGMPSTQHIAATTAGASGVATGMGALGLLGGAAALAADFTIAPRIFSPFATGMHAAAGGMASGGILGAASMGAAAFGLHGLATGAIGFGMNNIVQGAQQSAHMGRAIQGGYGFSGMNMGPMSVGLTNQLTEAALSVSRQAAASGFGGTFNPNVMTNMVSHGMQSGQFQGVSSVNEFRDKLKKMTAEASEMAKVLKISVDEAAQQITSLNQEFGLSGAGAVGMATSMGVMGHATGLSSQQQMGMAKFGSNVMTNLGLSRAQGAVYGLRSGQSLAMATRTGVLDSGAVADAGGIGSLQQRYTQAGISALNNRFGKYLLAATMDASGGFDEEFASQIASGGASREEIMRRGRAALRGSGRYTFARNSAALTGEFMSRFGAEGAVTGLGTVMSNKGARGEYLTQALTGLNSRDFDMLQGMGGQSHRIKMQMMDAARAGLREGGMTTSVSAVMDRMISKMVGPVRQKFRTLGQQMQQSLAETFESVGRDMLGMGPAPSNIGSNLQAGRYEAAMSGNLGQYNSLYGSGGTGHELGYQLGTPGPSTTLGAIGRSFMPAFMVNAAQGGAMGDMPYYGMYSATPGGFGAAGMGLSIMAAEGVMSHMATGVAGGLNRMAARRTLAAAGIVNPNLGRVGMRQLAKLGYGAEAAILRGTAGGGMVRGPIGGIGRALTEGGSALAKRLAGGGTSLMGMGGVGFVRGAAKGAAWGTKGLGWAMRGLGAVASKAALPLTILDAATTMPHLLEAGGSGAITSGIQGAEAGAWRRLESMGLLDEISDAERRTASSAGSMVGVVGSSMGGDFSETFWGSIKGDLDRGEATSIYVGQDAKADLWNKIQRVKDTTGTLQTYQKILGDVSKEEAQVFLENTVNDWARENYGLTDLSKEGRASFGARLRENVEARGGKFLNDGPISQFGLLGAIYAGTKSGGRGNFVDRQLMAGMKFERTIGTATTKEMQSLVGRNLSTVMTSYSGEDPRKVQVRKGMVKTVRTGPDKFDSHREVTYNPSDLMNNARVDASHALVNRVASEAMSKHMMGMDAKSLALVGQSNEVMDDILRAGQLAIGSESSEDYSYNITTFKNMLENGELQNTIIRSAELRMLNLAAAEDVKISRRMKDYVEAYNTDKAPVGEMINSMNLEGGKEIAASIDEMFKTMGKFVANPQSGLQSLNDQIVNIREKLAAMDPEDASLLATRLAAAAERQDNPELQRIAMMASATSNFKLRNNKAFQSPSKLINKQKVGADLFGGNKVAREAFGLEGSKEQRKWVREHIKRGELPMEMHSKLMGRRISYLMTQGVAKEEASMMAASEMANVERVLDNKGFTEKDAASPEVSQQLERNAMYGVDGQQGRSNKNKDVDAFMEGLKQATTSLALFNDELRGQSIDRDTPGEKQSKPVNR